MLKHTEFKETRKYYVVMCLMHSYLAGEVFPDSLCGHRQQWCCICGAAGGSVHGSRSLRAAGWHDVFHDTEGEQAVVKHQQIQDIW